jgi:hypothetical protein
MLKAFPFMALAVIVYNIYAVLLGRPLDAVVARLPMPSGGAWTVLAGDILVMAALVLLFVEMVAATSARTSSILNHGLSLVVFIICIVEFLLVPAAATSAFFLITLMTLLDVVAGYSISIKTARRDFALGHE